MGKGIIGEFGMNIYTLLYLTWITNKDLLFSTGNFAQCIVTAWMGEEFGGEWMHVHVCLGLLLLQLKLLHNYSLAIPKHKMGFPGIPMVKNAPANAEDAGLIPGLQRPTGGGSGNPLYYSCLENPMDRGAWWATVHGVTKS